MLTVCHPTQPDSQKGLMDQATDKMKSSMDSAASSMQPNVSLSFLSPSQPDTNPVVQQSQKSGSQRVGDMMSGNSNDNQVSGTSSRWPRLLTHFQSGLDAQQGQERCWNGQQQQQQLECSSSASFVSL